MSVPELPTARVPDLNGWYTVQRNPISRVGVFPYTAKSIGYPGWESDPDRRIMVYRPPEELGDPETIESMKLIPWIDDHTMLGDPALQEGLTPPEDRRVQGTTGEQIEYDPNSRTLYANIKVWGKKLAALIDAGKKELSLGFRCLYEFTEGVFEGQPFQAIQRRIRGNHNALVMNGRMGPGVAVLDHFDFAFDAEDFSPMTVKAPVKKQTLRQRIIAKLGTNATDAQILAALDAEEDPPADDGKGEPTLADIAKMLEGIAEPLGGINAAIAKLAGGGEPDGDEPVLDDDMEPVMDATTGKQKMGSDGKPMFAKKKVADAAPAAAALDAKIKPIATRLKAAEDAMATFTKSAPTVKTIMAEVALRDALAKDLTPFVGTFVFDGMTLAEVAKYGADKLEIKGVDGHEYIAVKSYLAGRTPPAKSGDVFALDAAPASGAGGKSPFAGYSVAV